LKADIISHPAVKYGINGSLDDQICERPIRPIRGIKHEIISHGPNELGVRVIPRLKIAKKSADPIDLYFLRNCRIKTIIRIIPKIRPIQTYSSNGRWKHIASVQVKAQDPIRLQTGTDRCKLSSIER
jgi:hypothetical protein